MKSSNGARLLGGRIGPALAAVFIIGCLGILGPTSTAQTYFFNRADIFSGVGSRVIVSAYLNGDGKPDLVVVNEYTNSVSVFLGKPDGTFQNTLSYPTGSEPESIVIADFNGDGKLDLAVGNKNDNSVSILLGNGDGTFQPKVDYATTAGPQSMAVGDFNGDGKLDLAVLGTNCSPVCDGGFYSILLGNGDGTFQSHLDYPTVLSPSSVQTADLNGDGKLDLVIADSGYNDKPQVCVYLGRGDGSFGSASCNATGQTPYAVSVADVNSDGKLDLIAANYGDSTVSVLLGNGDGTFQSHVDYATDTGPQSVTVGKFNGKADIITTNQISDDVSVLLGNGDGTFRRHVDYGAGDDPFTAVAEDFNGDGREDLATANYYGGTITVLLGKGDGTFVLPSNLAASAGSQSVTVADFNGDGKDDMAVANSSSNTVSVFLGKGDGSFQAKVDYPTGDTPSEVIAGDFNGDGNLDLAVAYQNCPTELCETGGISILLGNGDGTFQAAVNYPTSGSPKSLAAGDFNGDGKLDIVIANASNTTISVLLGNGDGSFQAHKDYSVGQYLLPLSVTVGDFNRDGKLDLAVLDAGSPQGELSIFLGNGDGTFQAPANYISACALPSCSIIAADFNGDGNLDLAEAALGVWIWLGYGNGTFKVPVIYNGNGGLGGTFLIAGDFNKDGKLDLAVASAETGINAQMSAVAILLGNGDGSFGPDIAFWNPQAASMGVAAGDFNGDGTLDLAAANSSGTVSVFLSAPVSALYPNRLNFGDQLLQTASNPLTVSLSNPGILPLSFASVAASGDFSETNSCPSGSSLPAGSSCTADVSFTPTAIGSRTGRLVFTDDDEGFANSVHTVILQGTGAVPMVGLRVVALTFSRQSLATSSTPQTITLSNTGDWALSISSLILSGADQADFVQTNTCGSSVAAGTNCTISVTFTPQGVGTRTATLTIEDNNNGVHNSTQTIALTGTGIGAVVSLSATSLNFGNVILGGTSSVQTVTLKNTGNAALNVTTIAASGDFTATNNCGASVAANGSCVISITFKPAAGGSRTGTLSIADSAAGSPQRVALSGSGEDFSFGIASGSSASASVSPGGTATYALGVSALGGLNQAISFTCTEAPSESTCTVSPASITPGSNTSKLTVSVATTALSMLGPGAPRIGGNEGWRVLALGLTALCLMVLTWSARRRWWAVAPKVPRCVATAACILLFLLALASCGGLGGSGAGNPGTPAGTYTLAITGTVTSGTTTLAHTVNLALKVR